MNNRFLEMERQLRSPTLGPRRRERNLASASSGSVSHYARPLAAVDRALVVLIENGGVDLELDVVVDVLFAATAIGSLLPDSSRTTLAKYLEEKIRSFTDRLLESAELALNRYSEAKPKLFGEVTVLRDGTASYADLKSKLIALSRAGKLIDLVILTHGSEDFISVAGGIDSAKIRAMKIENGKPLSLRSVYMMNCNASTLNDAWLEAGARASAGSRGNNYLPEPTNYFFWKNWQAGQSFETAVSSAYRSTINVINEVLRSFIRILPLPGSGLIADQLSIEELQFVRDSAPIIQGQRNITINSDDLTFTQSVSSILATTVVPVKDLKGGSLSRATSTGQRQGSKQAYSYHSPSVLVRPLGAAYSYMQNPAPLVVGGMKVVDAASLGLVATELAQNQLAISQGSFTLTCDRAQRLLSNEARTRMPGAQRAKQRFKYRLLTVKTGNKFKATANINIEWEGNPHGEMSTVQIERDLGTSTDWTRSSFNCAIQKVDRIPLADTDPRSWPIVFAYKGTFDPLGNGHFEFDGEFEINAFGGLRFVKHYIVSRSLADFLLLQEVEEYVAKGADHVAPTPPVPQEQIDFLRTTLP